MIDALAWDTTHFGFSVGRVRDGRLGPDRAAFESAAAPFRCVYLLANGDDAETALRTTDLGFVYVDGRLTLSVDLPAGGAESASGGPVRAARDADLPELERIAGSVHGESRFYFDARFPRDRVDELYRIWIRKAVREDSAGVLVADAGAGACGYTTCRIRPDGVGEIGLVGVAESVRGRGLGKALSAAALRWFSARGAGTAEVVTQARNVTAQRLYLSAGFVPARFQVWYHRFAR
ncbi:MAG TPA: GNAT family N-acetyltransferase [Polyangiaceae bacterium]|nr:GNAT family N-acetyltransferase [Polyangiaceae bacterium]